MRPTARCFRSRASLAGRTGLLDDIAGAGLRLVIGAGIDAGPALLAAARTVGARVIRVVADDATSDDVTTAHEADGIVTAWFARHGVHAALVRPDHYVYGVAADETEGRALLLSFSHCMETPR